MVTGSGKRLGQILAKGFADRGADIAVHYGHSAEGARETVDYVLSRGCRSKAFKADLSDERQTEHLFDEVVEYFGHVDILLNSAAIFEDKDLNTTDLHVWNRHFLINVTAPFLLSRKFIQHYRGREGVIINILDWRSEFADHKHFAYTVSKAALSSLTKNLAVSAAPAIRVNGLALGAILPPAGKNRMPDKILDRVPMQRMAHFGEFLKAAVFLASEPNYITGAILNLDGGRRLL